MNTWALCTLLQLLNSALQYKGSYQQYRDKWWSDRTSFMKTDHPTAFGCGLFFVDPCSFPAQALMLCSDPGTPRTHFAFLHFLVGPPRWCSGKESAYQCRGQSLGFSPWVVKISWRRKWKPTPVFLPEIFHSRGAWQATVYRVAKSQTRPSDGAHTHAFPCYCITELTNPEMTYLRSIAWGFLRCKATQGLISGDKTWIALKENGCLRIINKCIWG